MNTRREAWQGAHGLIPKGWVVHNMNGDTRDNRSENLACIPRNNIGMTIPPYRERIRNLERELKFLKETTNGNSTE